MKLAIPNKVNVQEVITEKSELLKGIKTPSLYLRMHLYIYDKMVERSLFRDFMSHLNKKKTNNTWFSQSFFL